MDWMEKRADATLQAIKVVRPAMDAFYASLSEEERAHLDSNSRRGQFWRWRERW
jgi:LTXXQ motif family protein